MSYSLTILFLGVDQSVTSGLEAVESFFYQPIALQPRFEMHWQTPLFEQWCSMTSKIARSGLCSINSTTSAVGFSFVGKFLPVASLAVSVRAWEFPDGKIPSILTAGHCFCWLILESTFMDQQAQKYHPPWSQRNSSRLLAQNALWCVPKRKHFLLSQNTWASSKGLVMLQLPWKKMLSLPWKLSQPTSRSAS